MSDKEALAGKVLKATMVEMILAFEKRLEVLEKKVKEGWNDYKFLQGSQIKRQDYLDKQIAELKEKYKLLEKSFKGNTNTDVDSHVKLANEIAELQKTFKTIDLCLKVDGRDIKLNRKVLRDVNNSLISLCEILDTKWNDPIDAIPLLAEWGHAEKTFLMKNNEKLDVGSASARESLDRQTERKGDKQIAKEYLEYMSDLIRKTEKKEDKDWFKVACPYCNLGNDIPLVWVNKYTKYKCIFCDKSFLYGKTVSGGEKTGEGRNRDSSSLGLTMQADSTDSKLPEPKPSMICGDGPEPRPKTEPEKDYVRFVRNYEGYWKSEYDKLIEKFLKLLHQFWDLLEGGGMNGNDLMDYIQQEIEKWQGRIK